MLWNNAGQLPLTVPQPAISFECAPRNTGNCASFASGLTLNVTGIEGRSGAASFLIQNELHESGIVNVYFDAFGLLNYGDVTFSSSEGVVFKKDGNPTNLPSGEPIGFHADFVLSAVEMNQSNGVGRGRSLVANNPAE